MVILQSLLKCQTKTRRQNEQGYKVRTGNSEETMSHQIIQVTNSGTRRCLTNGAIERGSNQLNFPLVYRLLLCCQQFSDKNVAKNSGLCEKTTKPPKSAANSGANPILAGEFSASFLSGQTITAIQTCRGR